MNLTTDDLAELLDRFELVEDPLLAWGVVDGGLSDDEVDEVINDWIGETGQLVDLHEVLDALIDAGILHQQVRQGTTIYRTRIAEALRLLARLRQLFPGRSDGGPSGWRGAPTLVAGFRYLRRPRQYPARDIDPADLMEEVTDVGSLEREVFRRLAGMEADEGFRMSGFQVRSIREVVGGLGTSRSTGVVVSAGTGSGKTLAFYLPAFVGIAGLIDGTDWTKVVALYPRNELLRDQLQSGVNQARRLAPILRERAGRPLRIGVLFGDVPHNPKVLTGRYGSWPKRGTAYACPYLRCPGPQGEWCGGELVMDASQLNRDDPRLNCADCGHVIDDEIFAVTRDQLRRRPPDVLYSSTEMLNRSLLDSTIAHTLGIDADEGPRLVLLDEIHTYGGTTGAMTGMTVRRWRNRLSSDPAFVGLSATLRDAPRFFADLVGLPEDWVVEVRPEDDELVPEGAEYLVAVRSDPVSGASVLSTTIQTTMLLGRVLDEMDTPRSQGLFGKKLFAFTDDLDVTNRLYFDLLDAEGQRGRRWGEDIAYKPSLAHLRAPTHDDVSERRRAGQTWDLVESIGHDLGEQGRLRVGRTSSQDVGVDSRAQAIVATASLEVGFDDPSVGAVLQHKAPRDTAAFIQRQGRAGRPRGMRPITAVVLSDYGRDREAYEAWDRLFSPVLPARVLPVGNVHVLRMQAALATLEWAAREAGRDESRNYWVDLARPADRSAFGNARAAAQAAVAEALRDLLADEGRRRELRAFISAALDIPAWQVDELLWHPPRAVILAAVPSQLRRIRSGWERVGPHGPLDHPEPHARQPLPEFVPATLFSSLALPEVEVVTPQGPPGSRSQEETPMDISHALREFSPGRVSRRFTIGSDLDRHWVAVPGSGVELDIDRFAVVTRSEGTIAVLGDEGSRDVPLVRPLRLETDQPPDDIRDTSYGEPLWVTQFLERGEGTPIATVKADPLARIVSGIRAHLHRDQYEVEVRRGSVGSSARLVYEDGREEARRIEFVSEQGPVAIGAAFDVDAIRIDVDLPDLARAWEGRTGRGLRSSWFRYRITTDPTLTDVANRFRLGWLHDIVTTALVREAVSEQISLERSWTRVRTDLQERLQSALEILLATPGLDLTKEGAETTPGRLRGHLEPLLEAASVREVLDVTVPALWEPPGPDANSWLVRRLRRTVGEAFLAGARLLCPEHDPEGVLVDVEPGLHSGSRRAGEVWLSETVVGGGGFLEAVADRAGRDPVRYSRLVRAALRPGSGDLIGADLERVVSEAVQDGPVPEAFAKYRASQSMRQRLAALAEVRDALASVGVAPVPEVVAAVANRLLRPGSAAWTDDLVSDSLRRWNSEEERLGVELDVRTWTFLYASEEGDLDVDKLENLQLLLWPRGTATRARALEAWNPYTDEPGSAPDVLEMLLDEHAPPRLRLGDPDLFDRTVELLGQRALLDVEAAPSERRQLADFIAETAVQPVDLDFLQLHPRLAGIYVEADRALVARLELPEVAQ